jgi:hypothetical protein
MPDDRRKDIEKAVSALPTRDELDALPRQDAKRFTVHAHRTAAERDLKRGREGLKRRKNKDDDLSKQYRRLITNSIKRLKKMEARNAADNF